MSFLDKIPGEIKNTIVDHAKDAVSLLWHTLTGEHDDHTAKDIAKETADHLAQLVLQEAQRKLGVVGLELAMARLKDRATEMGPWADDIMAKIRQMNEDDRKAFSPPKGDFDESDTTPVETPPKHTDK